MPSGCGARPPVPTPARGSLLTRPWQQPLWPHTPEAHPHPAGRAPLPASRKEAEAPAATPLAPGSTVQGRAGSQWCRHPVDQNALHGETFALLMI